MDIFSESNNDQSDLNTSADHGVITMPRVSIEVFCITSEFASVVQLASKDRRMARARMSIGMGNIIKATTRYETMHTPHLVILEHSGSLEELLHDLEKFSAVCGVSTKVVLAGSNNDIDTYRLLLHKGISEYITFPLSPSKVIDRICNIYADNNDVPLARTISFFSVKGGSGSSVLSHNFAKMLSQYTTRETVLVDCDIEFGTASLNLNLEAQRSIYDALTDVAKLDDVKIRKLFYEFSEYFKLLASPCVFYDDIDTSPDCIFGLIDTLKKSCEVCILDVPHSWQSISRVPLLASDDIVLVGTPDIASLRNIKTTFDYLNSHRLNDTKPKIIINQVGLVGRPEIAVRDFTEILETSVDLVIPFDSDLFGKAVNNGYLLEEINSNHEIIHLLKEFIQLFYKINSKTIHTDSDAKNNQPNKSASSTNFITKLLSLIRK